MKPLLLGLLSQACLEQVPLVDEPEMVVWEFNRAYTQQYFGKDGMGSLWGIMMMNTPYGRLLVACDTRWGRIIYSGKGIRGYRAAGYEQMTNARNADGRFPYVFVTDPIKGGVARFLASNDSQGRVKLSFDRWIFYLHELGVTKPGFPDGIAYSDCGTPSNPSDDVIYVTDCMNPPSIYKINALSGQLISEVIDPKSKRWWYPVLTEIAVGKTVDAQGRVINTNDLYVIDAKRNRVVHLVDGDTSVFQEWRYPAEKGKLFSVSTDACGRVYVAAWTSPQGQRNPSLRILDGQLRNILVPTEPGMRR